MPHGPSARVKVHPIRLSGCHIPNSSLAPDGQVIFVSAKPSLNSGPCPTYRSSAVDDPSLWGKIHFATVHLGSMGVSVS
eukprot:1201181-Pyramimonas_sp.AAC.1